MERALVHRAAVAEVFVTDMRKVGEDRYLAGAQLPLSHAYYSDHRQTPRLFDPLLLLEASRQAAVYGAHTHLGIPLSTSFLVNSLSVVFNDATALRMGGHPGELHLATSYPAVRRRGDEFRAVGVSQDLYLDGRPSGRVTMSVSSMSPKQYRALRYLQRDSEPPTTERAPLTAGVAAAAAAVARESALNVVVSRPVPEGEEVRAALVPRYDNRSLFDHTYDHVPAMVLAEGARQLALLAVADTGVPVERTWISDCSARFLRFAELDQPVLLSAPRRPAAEAGFHQVPVRLRHHDTEIAEISVTVATLPEEGMS
ncbi:ScbA/BarX family gamma-butyrolactone biosynthesis protein [Streptomyces xantholiticus]|uniref:ScbA/BarX family gamma-butyrolactone biosynthesis protein n=1 Tax=Streptomyces xantholiticus TaxID=68285 RepID=UPI00227D97BA|nr:ScbA/BarX family gamma-butyrolactone biosynthesis protein [Streptomyces xantholiticus]